MEWEFISAQETSAGSVEIGLRLASSAATRRQWDNDFEVEYRIRVGAELGMEFRVRNTSNRPIVIEEALHTYLSVSDVRQISVEGLANTPYSCTVPTPRNTTEGADPIRIVEETDRVYRATRATCIVNDPGWQRRLGIEKRGSETTVLWNPWIAKAKAMPDFGDDEWPNMLCIETCNVRDHAVTIKPGQSHTMGAVVSVAER
jgi:D-hexose-6-phosphate mutarotase